MINFASTVNKYTNNLQPATTANLEAARRWVDDLEATGGTAIDDALREALAMRSNDEGRTYTMVFFTDGQPTWGETQPRQDSGQRQEATTPATRASSRFGVGDDVNTVLLDALADNTKAISTYVRESEDIEAKVSSLYAKISNPVLPNLKLIVGDRHPHQRSLSAAAARPVPRHPARRPRPLHRQGDRDRQADRHRSARRPRNSSTNSTSPRRPATTRVSSRTCGRAARSATCSTRFASRAKRRKSWTRWSRWRSATASRRRTPAISWCRTARSRRRPPRSLTCPTMRFGPDPKLALGPQALQPVGGKAKENKKGPGDAKDPKAASSAPTTPATVESFLKVFGTPDKGSTIGSGTGGPDIVALGCDKQVDDQLKRELKETGDRSEQNKEKQENAQQKLEERRALLQSFDAINRKALFEVQQGKLGVDWAVANNELRFQKQLSKTANRFVQNRNVIDVGGIWIDDEFTPKMETVTIKSLSAAYFRMLERRPEMKDVFQLGNYLVWVTPSGKALIIDRGAGLEAISDADIDRLFTATAKTPKKIEKK